jgi:hypothetical protein
VHEKVVAMPNYELRFQIPERRLGESMPYQAFSRTVDRCMAIKGKAISGAKVTDVHVTGGSLFGSIAIDADTYESALTLICRETPIIQLEWHLEEEVSPGRTAELLQEALKLAK